MALHRYTVHYTVFFKPGEFTINVCKLPAPSAKDAANTAARLLHAFYPNAAFVKAVVCENRKIL